MKTLKLMLPAALAGLMLISCSDEKKAMLKVTHASPDAPGVDLYVDDAMVNTSALTYPNSTAYLEVTAGTRNIKVKAAGTSTTVINADVTFEADKDYSLFAANVLASIEAVLWEDNLTAPASGKAHIRFLHLCSDAPAVDVALDGGAVVFADYTFKEGSAFTPLDAGAYDLEVRLAGTSTVVLDLDPVTLEDGKIYTVFAKGLVAGSGSQALGAQIIVNN